jgi:hypothetical protein
VVDDLITGSDGLGGPPGERWHQLASLAVFSFQFSVFSKSRPAQLFQLNTEFARGVQFSVFSKSRPAQLFQLNTEN